MILLYSKSLIWQRGCDSLYPMTEKETKEEVDNRVYELGYHIVSSIPEEKLPAEVTAIKDTLEKHGASVIAEDSPKLKNLTYTMTKVIGPKHSKYDTAYFGWIKFEMPPENVEVVKKIFERADMILRFLIIKTVRESTLAVLKPANYHSTEHKPIPGVTPKKEGDVKSPVMSEAELDKTIADLIVE